MFGYGRSNREPPAFAPSDVAAMGRRPDDLIALAPGIELVDQVAEMDREIYRGALKEYGVSEKQLKKLKALDGLAKNGGRLLSVSLQMTHQNYVGQLHNLADVADQIKERLNGKEMQDGSTQPLDAEEYSYLAKVYVECVKQAGAGYELMMKGTEAMVRMMAAAKGTGIGNEKAQAGWGPMKKVRPNT